eukprot:6478766-Amphidinium_carterae.1
MCVSSFQLHKVVTLSLLQPKLKKDPTKQTGVTCREDFSFSGDSFVVVYGGLTECWQVAAEKKSRCASGFESAKRDLEEARRLLSKASNELSTAESSANACQQGVDRATAAAQQASAQTSAAWQQLQQA